MEFSVNCYKGEGQDSYLFLMDWDSTVESVLHSNQISWISEFLKQDSLVPLMSSSHAFALPHLVILAADVEDLFDNMSISFDNQVVQPNSEVVVAAEATKYRVKCLG